MKFEITCECGWKETFEATPQEAEQKLKDAANAHTCTPLQRQAAHLDSKRYRTHSPYDLSRGETLAQLLRKVGGR